MTFSSSIAAVFDDASAHHGAGRLEQALEGYAEILDRDPNYVATLVHVAELYWRHAREADARLVWDGLLALDEVEILSDMAGLAGPFLVLAAICLDSDRAGLTDRLLERAAELWPEEAPAHEFLAVRLFERGDSEGAEAHFVRAVELVPQRVEAWFNLAATRVARADIAGALTALDRVLDIDPAYNQALQQVIALVERLEDGNLAVHYLRRIQEAADENVDVLAYVGFRFMEAGDHEAALSAFAQAIDVDLEAYQALFGAAAAAHRLSEAAASEEYCRQGLASLPDDFEARLAVIRTFHQDLPAEAAASLFETSIRIAWNDRDGLRRIEEVAHELGWEAAAIRSRRRRKELGSP